MLAAAVASAIALRSWETRQHAGEASFRTRGVGGGYDSPCFPAKGPGTSPSPTVS